MTTNGVVTAFALEDPNSSPRGICVGPDGNLWFAEYQGDAIGRITPDGKVTEFSEPGASTSPWEIIAGTDGIMYVTDSTSDDIARFNPATLRWMSQIDLWGNLEGAGRERSALSSVCARYASDGSTGASHQPASCRRYGTSSGARSRRGRASPRSAAGRARARSPRAPLRSPCLRPLARAPARRSHRQTRRRSRALSRPA